MTISIPGDGDGGIIVEVGDGGIIVEVVGTGIIVVAVKNNLHNT